MGTGSSKPSAKKRPLLKGDCAPKKQKVSTEPVIGLMVEGNKTVTLAKQGGGKGLMVPPPGSQKRPPVLLREDPKYALWGSFLQIYPSSFSEMEDAKRRAVIRNLAAKKKDTNEGARSEERRVGKECW